MENHGHGQDGRFDFERLVVYQKAMEFLKLIAGLINENTNCIRTPEKSR